MINYGQVLLWFASLLAVFLASYFTYHVARRSKRDEIHIQKRHDLCERISVLLQEDHHDRRLLRENFERNFGHISDFGRAMEAFDQYDSLYADLRHAIGEAPKRMNELQDLNRRSAIYLDSALTNELTKYIESTRISYMTDGSTGLINTYAHAFFTALRDENLTKEQEASFKKIVTLLKKQVA